MDIESVREHCLSFPHATENVQWGNDLVFKIAGKMFAVVVLEGASKYCLSFKCTEERFAELIEQDGIDPAPYSARYHWVALETFDVLTEKERKYVFYAIGRIFRGTRQCRQGMALQSQVAKNCLGVFD